MEIAVKQPTPSFEELLSLAAACSTLPEFQVDDKSYRQKVECTRGYLSSMLPPEGTKTQEVEDVLFNFWWYAFRHNDADLDDLRKSYVRLTSAP